MFKIFRLSIAFVLMFLTVSMFSTCRAAKPTLAVLKIDNASYSEISELMHSKLLIEFQNSGRFLLVERDQLAQILREQGFQSLAVDPSQAVEIGKLAGAKYTLFNRVSSAACYQNEANAIGQVLLKGNLGNAYKGKVTLECRIIDNEKGILLFSTVVNGTKSGASAADAINGACIEAAQNAVKAFDKANPLVARVADFIEDVIYIDAGLDDGLKLGEKLIIMREGRPIEIDGKIVGMTETEIGHAKVTAVHGEYSVCRVTNGAGHVQKGDIVKREHKEG